MCKFDIKMVQLLSDRMGVNYQDHKAQMNPSENNMRTSYLLQHHPGSKKNNITGIMLLLSYT